MASRSQPRPSLGRRTSAKRAQRKQTNVVALPVNAGLEDLAAVKIVRLAELVQRLAVQRFEERFGLRNTDLRILNILDAYGSISVSAIARVTYIDKAWISRSVRQLEDKGLVMRAPRNGQGTRNHVGLTALGRRTVARVAPVAKKSEQALLRGLDTKGLKDALDVMLQNAFEALETA